MTDNTTLADELEACPHCGGKATMTVGGTPELPGHGYWVIGCYFNHQCKVKPVFYAHHMEEAEAIAAWNTRTPAPAPAQGDVERDNAFCASVQEALKGDHTDLQKEAIILRAHRAALAAMQQAPFQARVGDWMGQCFTPEIVADKLERSDRFIEEALELVQACGYDAARAHALVDYVFSRPVGEPSQEVGGVMVTLAALCNPHGLDMMQAGETELARILQPEIIEKIRAKQASKPTGSALPIPVQQAPVADDVRALVKVLQGAADDPMWADHCELNKKTVWWAVDLITRLTQPQADAVEAVAQGIADAQFGGPFNGLEWPEAWDHFEKLAQAAIAAHEPTVLRRIADAVESERAFIQKYIEVWEAGTGTVYLIDEAREIVAAIRAGGQS